MKIVVLDGYAANPNDLSWDALEQLGELTVYDRTPYEEEEILSRIDGAELVLTNKVPISRSIIEKSPSLQYIGVLATGFNVVDVDAARERRVTVTNIPAYSTDSVVQLVFAHLLGVCHHVAEHSQAVHDGQWQNSPDFVFWNYPLIELAGKTMGIIGFGQIGQKVAQVARALGMKVVAHSRTERPEGKALAEYVTLDALFEQSDVISLHCPLLPETQGIINKANVAKMKDGVILINTSRGPMVVEQDLRDALDIGKVSYAGVDVVSAEPIEGDNPLLGANNCYITPHIGWAPYEARVRLMDIAVKNARAFQEGKPVNVVNA